MIRSLLFIPGNQPNLIQNASLFDADAIIFDLEDAVHPDEKDNARMLVHQFLFKRKQHQKPNVFVRLNSMDTAFFKDDFDLLVQDEVDGFVYPKANVSDILKLNNLLNEKNSQVKIVPIIEDANAVLSAFDIASSERVIGLLLGGEDLAKDLEVQRTKSSLEIMYARQHLVMVCAAKKIISIDTPFTDVYDDMAFEEDTKYAKSIGMKAKSSIHPRHIEYINQTFSPTKEEIVYAKKVMNALKEAKEKKLGAFSVDGKMVDKPIIERAKRIIETAKELSMVTNDEE